MTAAPIAQSSTQCLDALEVLLRSARETRVRLLTALELALPELEQGRHKASSRKMTRMWTRCARRH